MRRALPVVLVLAYSVSLAAEAHRQLSLDDAWSAWRKGDIENAEEHYRTIDQSYERLDQLDRAMLHAWLPAAIEN